MGICQWILLGLFNVRLMWAIRNHGMSRLDAQGRPQKYDFGVELFQILVLSALLYFGGFFGRG